MCIDRLRIADCGLPDRRKERGAARCGGDHFVRVNSPPVATS